jgi:hypothetical protein
MLRLLAAPPAAAELEPAALVPVPAADEAADDVEAPAADELELELPPQAATPSASAAAVRSRAGSLNMARISFFVVSRDGRKCPGDVA